MSTSFEHIEGGAKGYYHQTEQRIAIKEVMSQLQTVETAIHEMAHQKLHAIEPKETGKQSKDSNAQPTNSKELRQNLLPIPSVRSMDSLQYFRHCYDHLYDCRQSFDERKIFVLQTDGQAHAPSPV